jgi:pimeloyl-ACP methyl ester carboxylesterase
MDRFRSGSLTFPVKDSGPGATGETVILLHGFPQTASSWDALTASLGAAGYRVLAPDQRGYAPGAQPRGRRAYRISELVSDVIALIDAADLDHVHLVGHDWGAAVAWAVAAEAPERLASLTALSVPHPTAFTRAVLTSSQALRSWYMLFFQLPWLPERLLDPCRPGGRQRLIKALVSSGQTQEQAERDAEALAIPGALTGALNWYRALPFSGRPLGAVSVPTLYVWSNGDHALGRKGAELTARFVTGPYTFKEIGGSHWIQGDVADLVLAQLATSGANAPQARERLSGGSGIRTREGL